MRVFEESSSLGLIIYGLEVSDESHSKTLSLLKNVFQTIYVVRVSTERNLSSPYKKIAIEDPGNFEDGTRGGLNFNRMLLQMQRASAALSTDYILVMRSDLVITGTNFINLQKTPKLEGAILDERIVTTSIYFKTRHFSRHFKRSIPAAYHPSDWIWFGLKKDVERMYSGLVPLSQGEAVMEFCSNNNFNPYSDLYSFRFPTEMLFGLNLAGEKKKHCFLDYDRIDRNRWLVFCHSNLIILPARKFSFEKISGAHQRAIKFPFFEPTMVLSTINSRRLNFTMLLKRIRLS